MGELAKQYYPGGHDITTLDYEQSVRETSELLAHDAVTIYEAAIQVEDFFCARGYPAEIRRGVGSH